MGWRWGGEGVARRRAPRGSDPSVSPAPHAPLHAQPLPSSAAPWPTATATAAPAPPAAAPTAGAPAGARRDGQRRQPHRRRGQPAQAAGDRARHEHARGPHARPAARPRLAAAFDALVARGGFKHEVLRARAQPRRRAGQCVDAGQPPGCPSRPPWRTPCRIRDGEAAARLPQGAARGQGQAQGAGGAPGGPRGPRGRRAAEGPKVGAPRSRGISPITPAALFRRTGSLTCVPPSRPARWTS
jgi:hypothetical protein